MSWAAALATLLVMLPAAWAVYHLCLSRISELRADRLEQLGQAEDEVRMLRKNAVTLQDLSRLMPNWMLASLVVGLSWRALQLLRDIWVSLF